MLQALLCRTSWSVEDGRKMHLLWVRIISPPCGRPHYSAIMFWDIKYHYDCDFLSEQWTQIFKPTQKMEGDDVDREHLIPILSVSMRCPSLQGPHTNRQGRASWGWEGFNLQQLSKASLWFFLLGRKGFEHDWQPACHKHFQCCPIWRCCHESHDASSCSHTPSLYGLAIRIIYFSCNKGKLSCS